ncbi:MAG: hypothetical protein ACMXYM_03740 [Candidatus Woesearchaeota archaeon]
MVVVFGSGLIGDKAEELIRKTPLYASHGFAAPPRVVIASDVLEDLVERVRVRDPLQTARLENDLMRVVEPVCSCFEDRVLVARSSAEGDARGSGIYASVFSRNDPRSLGQAVSGVLESYWSADAVALREDAGLGEGLAVLVEPLVGGDVGSGRAPSLSGLGYSSTAEGEGIVVVVPGIGGGAFTRGGERITLSSLCDGSLREYIDTQRTLIMLSRTPLRGSRLLRTDISGLVDHEYHGDVFAPDGKVQSGVIDRRRVDESIDRVDLPLLFDAMNNVEDIVGCPQYIEWALAEDHRFSLIQAADARPNLDSLVFESGGATLFYADSVVGTGSLTSELIVRCRNPDAIPALHAFDRFNAGYVLIYSSRLVRSGSDRDLYYGFVRNAAAFVEEQDSVHSGDPLSHLCTEFELAGKPFGVLDQQSARWDRYNDRASYEYGIEVYRGLVRLQASERENRMRIAALEP